MIKSRVLYENDVIIVATDGACLHWTTESGMPYVPFEKSLNKCENSEDSFKRSAGSWIDFLRQKQAITDDATLILVKV